MLFAVIDTNVLVSYFLSKDSSPPVVVVEEIFGGRITPLYNDYLFIEYRDVLGREKFGMAVPLSSLAALLMGQRMPIIAQGVFFFNSDGAKTQRKNKSPCGRAENYN